MNSSQAQLFNSTRQQVDRFTRELAFTIFDSRLNAAVVSSAIILGLAVTLIALGSYSTIEMPSNALEPNENHPLFDQSDRDRTREMEESVNGWTAAVLPFIAGAGLVTVYLALRYVGRDKLMKFLMFYVILVGVHANKFTLSFLYKLISRRTAHYLGISSLKFNPRYSLTVSKDSRIHPQGFEKEMLLPEYTERERAVKETMLNSSREPISAEDQEINFYFTRGDVLAYSSAVSLSVLLTALDYTNNWLLSNVAGSALAIYGVAMLRLPSFKILIFLLSLFFFYDIFFVFGTDVMVEVATNVDIPMKLQVPNSASRETGKIGLSMLGLGDIVLPGCAIALCLRFDLYNFHETHPRTEFHHLQRYRKPYFTTALIAYSIGLVITFAVVYKFQTGQPALLYLSPAIILAVLMTAAREGQLSEIWLYDEDEQHSSRELEVDIVCSKDTLYLAGEPDLETDDETDPDYTPGSD